MPRLSLPPEQTLSEMSAHLVVLPQLHLLYVPRPQDNVRTATFTLRF